MSSETFPMVAADPTPAVNRAYQQGQVFGWVREAYVNAVQANATQVTFTTEWIAAEATGVHRRVILDNGDGMSPEDIPGFFNTWGGSAQSVGGVNENYGYGTKVSLLPWNAYGVVVLTRQEGETSMMWLHRGADDRYGVRALENDNDDGSVSDVKVLPLSNYDSYLDPDDDRVDWVEVSESIFGEWAHGTALVLLGNEPNEHTAFYGDQSRHENFKFGIAQYLNGRFYKLPVPVTIDPVYPSDPDEWPTRHGSKNERRQARGLGETITKGSNDGIVSGTVDLTAAEGAGLAARVHWWLAESEVPTSGDRNVIPLFGYKFASHGGVEEIYALESNQGGRHLGQLVVSSPVRRRVGILIEPINGESLFVYPAGNSRAGLQYDVEGLGGGHELPFLAWKAAWLRKIPEPIREAILAAMPQEDAHAAVDAAIHKYLADEFLPYLQTRRDAFVTDPDGEKASGEKGPKSRKGDSERGGSRRIRRSGLPREPRRREPLPRGQDAEPSSVARRQAGLVNVAFVTESENSHAVWYDQTAGVQTAYINRSSATYQRAFDYLVNKYRNLGRIGEEGDARWAKFVQLVEQSMRTQVTTAITELLATASEDKTDFDKYMSPEACSATLMGLNWISQAMARSVTSTNLPVFGPEGEADTDVDEAVSPVDLNGDSADKTAS